MTYDEALAFWYGRVNYERSAPQPGDLKLDRMRALLHRLGDPHGKLCTIHVAGSKGKGSICAMLASVLRCAGYRTGLFTSPHLEDVRERIQIDGELISRDELAALMAEIRPAAEALEAEGQPPTFFEVGTALGFLHFLRRGCDIAVIEVGLGGRFDSTNVIEYPLVTIIASISYDHTAILGDKLAQIAYEKAGIIKDPMPVVTGVREPEVREVIDRVAEAHDTNARHLGDDFDYNYIPGRVNRDGSVLAGTVRLSPWLPKVPLGLLGAHQAANAAVAHAAICVLRERGLEFPDAAIAAGLANVHWPARMEVFRTQPLTVLDCAHNVASAEALAFTLAESFDLPRRSLIFAVSSDKDVPGMFRVLVPHFQRFYLTRYTSGSRSVPPEQLAAWLPADKERVLCPTPADAWRAACADATPETLVVIAGSVFLAGELRPLLVEESQHNQS